MQQSVNLCRLSGRGRECIALIELFSIRVVFASKRHFATSSVLLRFTFSSRNNAFSLVKSAGEFAAHLNPKPKSSCCFVQDKKRAYVGGQDDVAGHSLDAAGPSEGRRNCNSAFSCPPAFTATTTLFRSVADDAIYEHDAPASDVEKTAETLIPTSSSCQVYPRAALLGDRCVACDV